ncbi:MAG: macro domain-containing protein [Lachnospiraceae bacterium oral taxon 082]|nr:macro domain-containing protein [Lachnospiraceae bacterium oral taxon 082]
MPFKIIKNDITKVKVDAIVNTVNPNAIIGDGVEYAIYNAAGKDELLKAREKLGYMPPGEVGITPAFKLDAKYIIHVSSPVWAGGWYGECPPESVFTKETILLGDCYMKALYMAAENGCKSIAFPLLATGTYKFPKEIGMAVAVRAFTEFLKHYDMEIFLVVFGRDSSNISGSLFRKVKRFVDYEEICACAELAPRHDLDWIDGSTIEDDEETESYRDIIEDDGALYYESLSRSHKHSKSLEESLKKIHKYSFAGYLQQLINKKGMKNSEVYATANITKQYFSKLINGKVNPSKEKVIALAIGLHLNMDETKDILKIAGYAFSPFSQTDTVVKYFINNKDYNVIKLDILLYDFGLDPISS